MPVPDFSPGEVLTAAAMDSIGLWKITTQSMATGTLNVDITNCFSANYSTYKLVFTNVTTASAVETGWQGLGASPSPYNVNYNATRWSSLTPTTPSTVSAASAGYLITTGTTPQSYEAIIYNPFITGKTTYSAYGQYGGNADAAYIEMNSAINTGSVSFTGIRCIATGTTWTAGSVTVYGLR